MEYLKSWWVFSTTGDYILCTLLELHLDNFIGDFLNIWIFLHHQIPDFLIVVSRPTFILS